MKTIFFLRASLLCICLLLSASLNTFAGIVTNILIDSVSSEFGGRTAARLVDGSGLYGEVHTTFPGHMWLTAGPASPVNQAEVTFDLGSVRSLTHLKVWNYNETTAGRDLPARGVATADLLVAGDDKVFTNVLAAQSFTKAPGSVATNFGQTISLGGLQARYVKIDVLSNYGDPDFVGLSEVQFFDTSAPKVLSAARKFSNREVTVQFDEPMLLSSATNASNYSVGGGITISNARVGLAPNTIVLATSPLQTNNAYTLTVNNVRDALNSVAVATNSQVPIGSELALWLRADAGVTSDFDGYVSAWADQSGHSNSAQQVSLSLQPLLVTNVFNGQPALRFDGLDDFLTSANSPSLAITSHMAIFAVLRLANYSTYNAVLGKTVGNLPAPYDYYFVVNSGRPSFFRGDGAAFSNIGSTTSPATNATSVVSVAVRGFQGAHYLNGAATAAGTLAVLGGDGGGDLDVGTRADRVTQLSGDLAELLVFNAPLSDSERVAVDNYLGTKYGVPIITLVFNEQPASTNVLEGEVATFRVNVSANSPDIAYQWQRNGTNIAGATNWFYTTPELTRADSNSLYRVIVSIPGASQTSQPAVLSVSPDRVAPTVASAGKSIVNSSEVTVVFSEPVSATTATNKSNYTFDNGITVSNARMGATPNTVVLTTSSIPDGVSPKLTISGVQDRFGNVIVASSQVTVGFYPAGLALWLKSDPAQSVGPAGEVSVWTDLSGNGNNATQTDTNAQPILVTNALNGKAVVRFDGADDHLIVATSPTVEISGDMTLYAEANFTDFANYNSILGKTAVNLPASYDFYTVAGSGTPRFYRGDGGGANGQVSGTVSPTAAAPHLLTVVMSGKNVSHYLDGQANGTGILDTVMADTGAPLYIGSRGDLFTKMKGDFAEILLFSTAVNDADRQAIDAYFGAKYGVLVTPAPRLTATRAGNQLTISWPAGSGTDILEGTSVLPATLWNPVAPVTQSNGTNSATVTMSGSAQFFRVRRF